jgi:flagellar M-ring protein FliF
MVALAISGLAPEDVAVIDSLRGIIAGPNVDKMTNPSVVADDISQRLEAKVQRLLEARLGAGNSEVSVTVDVTRALERTSAVRFDPESRVIRQKTTNDANQTGTTTGGALTVASNLPQGAGANGGGTNTARNSTESVSYEVNETRTEVERLPGEIKRISVAVMLNEQAVTAGAAGGTGADLLAEFEGLISSAAGLDVARGDVISVEIMPFNVAQTEAPPVAPTFIQTMLDRYMWSGLQALLLSIVVLVLGLGVIRPILRPKTKSADEADGSPTGDAQSGSGAEADPFAYLKDYAREREEETAALLQEWLAEDSKVAVNES